MFPFDRIMPWRRHAGHAKPTPRREAAGLPVWTRNPGREYRCLTHVPHHDLCNTRLEALLNDGWEIDRVVPATDNHAVTVVLSRPRKGAA